MGATDVRRKAIDRGCEHAEYPWFEALASTLLRSAVGRADAVDCDPGAPCARGRCLVDIGLAKI